MSVASINSRRVRRFVGVDEIALRVTSSLALTSTARAIDGLLHDDLKGQRAGSRTKELGRAEKADLADDDLIAPVGIRNREGCEASRVSRAVRARVVETLHDRDFGSADRDGAAVDHANVDREWRANRFLRTRYRRRRDDPEDR
jgi:hypothetical protein